MRLTRKQRIFGARAVLPLIAGLAGCRVNVNKGAGGEDKSVHVDTPFGGFHVNTNQTTAADLGLPVYPGAQPVTVDDEHKSADVHMGFGEWELRVRAVTYGTSDSEDKVLSFYKQALGRFGDVITCRDKSPVGTPSATSEGLTCAEDKEPRVQLDHGGDVTGSNSLELKAGSKRHQHVVGFEQPKNGQTRFVLVALDLPAIQEKSGDKSD